MTIIKPVVFDAKAVKGLLNGVKTQHRFVLRNQEAWTKREAIVRRFPEQKAGVPYRPGHLIWVQEALQCDLMENLLTGERDTNAAVAYYAADDEPALESAGFNLSWLWKVGELQPQRMPRNFSRFTLEVTKAQVQRLQEISAADAEAEGVFQHIHRNSLDKVFRSERGPTALKYFRETWDEHHAASGNGWDANRWVQAVTFEIITANVDDVLKARKK